MGNPKAFLTIPRKEAGYRPIHDRIKDFSEVEQTLNTRDRMEQASRCMNCGVPFCHWACPLGNQDPDFNDAIYKGEWETAYHIISQTNDFPEFTGRVCPAGCEKACVLYLTTGEGVTNRENECAIIEHAFAEGFVVPLTPKRNGKSVAIIGSGPAGLAAANRLNHEGFSVTVFEVAEAAGGLLRYGIPNFKLNKSVIDRRISLMEAEGVEFKLNSPVDCTKLDKLKGFDAYVVATGTPEARDLSVPGRALSGIHFALDILGQQNRILAGQTFGADKLVNARGKHVLVIGGGDTGSDCIGTANRQGAKSVTQIEIMPKPPVGHNPATPWPAAPAILKTTSSHEEGCTRRWLLNTNRFIGRDGRVVAAEVEGVIWEPNPQGGRPIMKLDGRKELIECDLVLLAMGFLRPKQPEFAQNVFVCGDAATGPGLVVKAIASGRQAARDVQKFLLGR